MNREFSTYLDAIRFTAAMLVVVSHFTFSQFIADVPYQGALAGMSVTVFFVLSGYVIAYVADQKEHTLREFAVSRLARVYSVALPALALTILIDLYMLHKGVGQNVPVYEYRSLWKYLPIFLTFTSEIGPMHVIVLTDGTFWSLSYEVWYYVAFAAVFYLRGVWRIVAGLAALAILGLPALMYLPVWLLGTACYCLHQRTKVSPAIASIGAIVTASALIGLWAFGFMDAADGGAMAALHGWPKTVHNSMNFPSHYIAGVLTAAHFYFVRYCSLGYLRGRQTRAAITYMASFTFALYLAHRPLMDLWAFLLDHDPHSIASVALLFWMVMFSVWCFAFISEHKKTWWRGAFSSLLGAARKTRAA